MNSFSMQVAHIVHEERLRGAAQHRAHGAEFGLNSAAQRLQRWLHPKRHGFQPRHKVTGADCALSPTGR